MSQYGFAYRASYDNAEVNPDGSTNVQRIIITLWDTTNIIPDEDEQLVYLFDTAGDPLHQIVIDNDEDKFTPIRSKQAKIKALTSDSFGFETFADDPEGKWLVQIDINQINKTFFKGFLVLRDNQELWQPDPNELVLTASDNLGILKDIPLTDFDGLNPQFENRIADYLTWVLSKTGLSLELYCIMNIREEDFPDDHFYDVVFLDAKTFEKEIGTCVDCYQALQIILGEDCFITQWKGGWWIKRVDEFDTHGNFIGRFDTTGAFVNFPAETEYNKAIGEGLDIDFINEDCLLKGDSQHEHITETFNFDYPKEIVCNIDFSRGDFIEDLPDEEVDGIDYKVKTYEIECWEMVRGTPLSPSAPTVTPYIKRRFTQYDYEHERFIVIPDGSDFSTREYLTSIPIPVSVKDKFTVSVDWRLVLNISSGTTFPSFFARLVLHGEDDSWWILGGGDIAGQGNYTDTDHRWLDTAGLTTNTLAGYREFDTVNNDERDWINQTWDAPPVPVSGKLYIWLYPFGNPSNNYEVHYSNLTFDYVPYINGSYRKYTSQYHKISQVTTSKAIREKQVYISDSPKKLFKGALLKYNGTDYVLTGRFYNAAVFPGGLPADEFLHPFGEIQAFSVWNQYRLASRIFMPTLQGLQTDALDQVGLVDVPDLIHKYGLADDNPNSNDRYFQVVTFDQDFHLCEWKCTLIEVYNNVGKDYDSPHEFRYTT